MRRTVLDHLDRLDQAKDVGEVERLLVNWCEDMGFGRTVLGYFPHGLETSPHGLETSEPLLIGSYSRVWLERYLEENYAGVDVVVERSFQGLVPFTWGDRDDRRGYNRPQKKLFSEADTFGISRGVSVPVHGPGKSMAIMSVATDEGDAGFTRLAASSLHAVHLGCSYTHQRVVELMDDIDEGAVSITPRETDCLLWSSTGKSDWETAEILAIPEKAVARNLASIMRKLGVHTRADAVAKALRLRLISL